MAESPTPNDRLRTRSGSVDSDDPLVSILYSLVRDHVQPGTIEMVVQEEEAIRKGGIRGCKFSNGYLARYCEDLALRIRALNSVGISPIQTEE